MTLGLGRLVGLVDRGGFDATSQTFSTWSKHAYNSILGGLVVNGGNGALSANGGLSWAQLQTTAGSPAGSHALAAAGTAYIDAIFDQVDAYNNTNPVLSGTTTPMLWTVLMRIFAGESAPAWAQSLAGGPISVAGAGGTMGCWWTTGVGSYIAAYVNFMTVLAAYVPSYTVRSATSSGGLPAGVNTQPLAGHPLLGQLVLAPTMTLYAETMMKDDYNGGYNSVANGGTWSPDNSLLPTPYTPALDEAALASTFTSVSAVFGTTPLSLSHNPYILINATGKSDSTTETVSLMGSFVSDTTSPHGVLANNSLRANGLVYPPADGSNPGKYQDTLGPNYTTMYTTMAGYGPSTAAHVALGLGAVAAHPCPIEFQTATYAKLGGTATNTAPLVATVNYAAWLGARAVELPGDNGGYTNLSLSALAALVPQLLANDVASSVPTPTAGTFKRWHSYRHH